MIEAHSFWKKCSACKKPIAFKALYYVCNVSTCNRLRTGLSFCSVECWDSHVPMMRHRESWAEERHAPADGEPLKSVSPAAAPEVARGVRAEATPSMPAPTSALTAVRAILRKKG